VYETNCDQYDNRRDANKIMRNGILGYADIRIYWRRAWFSGLAIIINWVGDHYILSNLWIFPLVFGITATIIGMYLGLLVLLICSLAFYKIL
jgi:hypothetical protein